MSDPHGDVYAGVSKQIARKFNKTLYVPHMISLQPCIVQDNIRTKLNIPLDAVVFSRYGGMDTFNLEFCRKVIKQVVNEHSDRHFMFINTPEFYNHRQIHYLQPITTDIDKSIFIQASDAHLECSDLGHSFGLAIGEYSVHNKPVIAFTGPVWNTSHLEILGDKVVGFQNESDFYRILTTFDPKSFISADLNCYKEFSPEKVMASFKKVFID